MWRLTSFRRISSNFNHEINQIRSKYSSAGYWMAFLNSVKNDFESKKHDPMIPKYLFNDIESKPILLIDIPFCNESERVSKQLLKKFRVFTKEKDNFRIVCKSKRVRQLFLLKEKNPYIPFMQNQQGNLLLLGKLHRWNQTKCYHSLEWAWKSEQSFRNSQASLSTPWSCFSMKSSNVSTYE